MTQYERMVKGLLYDPADPEIMEEQSGYQEALWAFNQLKPAEMEKSPSYWRLAALPFGRRAGWSSKRSP